MNAICLFNCSVIGNVLLPGSLSIKTPRGTIASTLSCGVGQISSETPEKIAKLSTHSHIGIWDNELMHAELLQMQYQPVIPAHMQVTYSWAYLWRIKAKKNLPPLILDCFFIPNTAVASTDIQTGEGLYAICAFFEEDSVYIGTEDEDFLYQRAEVNKSLPFRYAKEKLFDCSHQPLLSSNEHNIHINFPPPQREEIVQLQFVVAGGRDATSNWFAVEANPRDILSQAGCDESF